MVCAFTVVTVLFASGCTRRRCWRSRSSRARRRSRPSGRPRRSYAASEAEPAKAVIIEVSSAVTMTLAALMPVVAVAVDVGLDVRGDPVDGARRRRRRGRPPRGPPRRPTEAATTVAWIVCDEWAVTCRSPPALMLEAETYALTSAGVAVVASAPPSRSGSARATRRSMPAPPRRRRRPPRTRRRRARRSSSLVGGDEDRAEARDVARVDVCLRRGEDDVECERAGAADRAPRRRRREGDRRRGGYRVDCAFDSARDADVPAGRGDAVVGVRDLRLDDRWRSRCARSRPRSRSTADDADGDRAGMPRR